MSSTPMSTPIITEIQLAKVVGPSFPRDLHCQNVPRCSPPKELLLLVCFHFWDFDGAIKPGAEEGEQSGNLTGL